MVRYFFVLEGPAERDDDKEGTLLPDNNAASAYAERIIRELKEAHGYDAYGRKIIVQNHDRKVVHIIPF